MYKEEKFKKMVEIIAVLDEKNLAESVNILVETIATIVAVSQPVEATIDDVIEIILKNIEYEIRALFDVRLKFASKVYE